MASPNRNRSCTLAAFVELYLGRHAVAARPRTIGSLRQRLRYATDTYGDVPLRELERMVDELAGGRRGYLSAPATASSARCGRRSAPPSAGDT